MIVTVGGQRFFETPSDGIQEPVRVPLRKSEQVMRQLLVSRQPPAWRPDAESPECTLCGTAFRITLRRHHCRHCGEVVCDPCSRGRLTLENLNLPDARVCDDCLLMVQVHKALEELARKAPLQTTPTHTVQPASLDVNRV